MTRALRLFRCLLLIAASAQVLRADPPACAPCAGVRLDAPYAALAALSAPPALDKDARLYAAFETVLDATATPAAAHALAGAGATPWVRLVFRTPAPLTGHLDALTAELDAAAAIARSRPPRAHYQLLWRPAGDATAASLAASEYAFLVKRASVALTGEDPNAQVVSEALPADPEWLRDLYGAEVAAYLDAVAFAPAEDDALAAALATISQIDPGKTLVLDGAPWPAPAELVLPVAATAAARGFAIVLFASPQAPAPKLDAAQLAPLKVLANEFRGELSFDPTSAPTGAAQAWSFVRGQDLALRVIATPPAGGNEMKLSFAEAGLRRPAAINLATGTAVDLGGDRQREGPLALTLRRTGPAVLLRLERATAEEREGIAEKLIVAGERQVPVEEILRRLQAFEEAQNRRVVHWQAVNATTLRFAAASGIQAIEATFEGEVFFRPGQPFDWAWQNFYLNGVKWRGKSIPEIPLVQPQKAAAMPLEILFTKEYRYSLRGAESVRGRDCWAIEFEPSVPVEGKTLFRGTVWVDRATWARVRTRAIQLGLKGEVISNEETIDYTPVDESGKPAAWGAASYVLPLHTVGQQLLSIVNTATVVEREVTLTAVAVNGDAFDTARERAFASDSTMVRDTQDGLRYLVKEGATPGERVVKEGYDSDKLFALAGLFYDDSLSYPLPLVGLNYFSLNFHGQNRQLNAFFGGVLGIVNYADPHLLGSKVDLGVDIFGIGVASTDKLFRDGVESRSEEVKDLPARVTLNLGVPLGNFLKLSGSYRLAYSKFSTTDHTSPDFVLPSDHFRHHVDLGLQFARAGYRLNFEGGWNRRSTWDPWGLPGNTEYNPDQQSYETWEASASKNWYFAGFRKLGLEINYLDGRNLDRFSKYQFGFFGGSRVHGYQIGKVRAEKALAAHLTAGLEIGKALRIDAVGDAAWATDQTSGLDKTLLAGVGLVGSFMGPWETIVQLDVGTPVAGPDNGVVAYIVFLKLFK